jgi:hypothetical protein
MLGLTVLVLSTLPGALHVQADVTGLLVPRDLAATEDAPTQPTFFRGQHRFRLYAPSAGHALEVTVLARQIGQYPDQVEAALIDNAAEPPVALAEGSAAPGGQIDLAVAAPRAGTFALVVRAGQNAATVEPGDQWLIAEASREEPVRVISRVGPLFFFVPPNTADFSVGVKGQGAGENARVSVCQASGGVIADTETHEGAEAILHVRVPPAPRGTVYRLELGPAQEGIFEDATVWLSEQVPPYVSLRADGLLVPFVHGLVTPPVVFPEAEPRRLPFVLNVRPDTLAAEKWEVMVAPASRPAAVLVRERWPVGVQGLSLKLPPDMPDGDYQLRAQLLGRDDAGLASGTSPLLLRQGVAYVGGWRPLVAADLIHPPESDAPPTLLVHRRVPPLPESVEVQAQLQGLDPQEPLAVRTVESLGGQFAPPKDVPPGHYRWRLTVTREADRLPLDWTDHCFYWRGDRAFEEVKPPLPQAPLPPIAKADRERQFVAFVPDDVEAIPYNVHPSSDEIARDARIFAARGEYEPATIGILSLADQTEVAVEVEPLSGPQRIPAERIDVRIARYWPQRMSWNSPTYHFIPELLERGSTVRLNAFEVGQIWLTVPIPQDAVPGEYHGRVRLKGEKGQPVTKRLTVEVLPFSLATPKELCWGLYTDSGRWNAYSPERVEAELADIVAHGYTTLLVYPLRHANVAYEDGHLKVDLSPFESYMGMAIEAGLRAPWVMDLQELQSKVQTLLGRDELVYDEAFEKLFTGICSAIRDAAEANDWGEILLHVVDEPNRRHPALVEKAKRQLGYARSTGCRTWTTVLDLEALAEEFDPQLDVRCYSLSYLIGSEDANRSRRQETAASGDELQWYGSGCYTFAGGQEGHVYSNRILMGYLHAKSGATTQFTWTFQRPKADPYDDFDGEVQQQAKDACTTYPDEDGEELVPTLQWEGCREGIDDARYVVTLREAIEQARDREAARAAQAELGRLLDEVGWGIKPRDFTNQHAQKTRRAIADLIVKLTTAR